MSSDGAGDEPGHRALAALDRALAGKPKKDSHDFSAAAMGLAQLRDQLVARQRGKAATGAAPTAAERERLARLNAVLSVVLGGHFPRGSIPWPELQRAREWLRDILAEID